MISIGSVASSGAAEYYAKDNYYSDDATAPAGLWLGEGARRLGLEGAVDTRTFEAVLDGQLPDGSVLISTRGEHRPGFDLTFSASKSVSLLALLGKDERLIEAFRGSVADTLKWAERNLAQTRVSKGGQQVVENSGNLIAAAFTHDINRNSEPQLHVHAVIANATFASDGKWHALHNHQFYKWQHTIGTVHNAALRARVEALGYETVPAKNGIDGSFEIKGVSRRVVEAFSSRRAEILAAMEQSGRSSPRERELITLATRKGKEAELAPTERKAAWVAAARTVGFDPQPLIGAARSRVELGRSLWDRAVEKVRGIHAKGLALAARVGLSPKDGDLLVPERKGALDPRAFVAAQAVASAARELSEREAGFDRLQLLRSALERGGPVVAEDIEARIALLEKRGLLLGNERMVTSSTMLALEKRVLREMDLGKSASAQIVPRAKAAMLAQSAAKELGLRRLNPGQESAAAAILSTSDRVHLVQGGAGTGKSASLAPVARVAMESGHRVFALAIATRTAREFGAKLGVEGTSVGAFLARYGAATKDGEGRLPAKEARAALRGAVIMVDEASMVGTEQFEKLLRLANAAEAARIVMAGDVRQLLAIEAGKPFEQAQTRGVATSRIEENLRAASPQMKAVVAALEDGDMRGAFNVLKSATIELPLGEAAGFAAKRWADLPMPERDKTLLLTASRAMRSDLNRQVQARLAERGELSAAKAELTIHDQVTITREGARQLRAYQPGRLVEFRSNLRVQNIERGERGRVIGLDGRKVLLKMEDGRRQAFEPHRLARNLKYDAVTVFEEKQIDLHVGDNIRWTTNDHERGLANSDTATVTGLKDKRIEFRDAVGKSLQLDRGDPMLAKLDLAYALNVHLAQGVTAENGIIVMSERERMLNSSRAFLVAATRFTGEATLVVDNAQGIEKAVRANPGDKTSALAITGKDGLPDSDKLREIARGLGLDRSTPRGSANEINPRDFGKPEERLIERSR